LISFGTPMTMTAPPSAIHLLNPNSFYSRMQKKSATTSRELFSLFGLSRLFS
jgi:hypothetical protein